MKRINALENIERKLLANYRELNYLLMDSQTESFLFSQLLKETKLLYGLQENIISSFSVEEIQDMISHFKYFDEIQDINIKTRITRLFLEQYILVSNEESEFLINKENATYHMLEALKKTYLAIFFDDELKEIDWSFQNALEKEFYTYLISVMLINSKIEKLVITNNFDINKCAIPKLDGDFQANSFNLCRLLVTERSNNNEEIMNPNGVVEMLYISFLLESYLNDLSQDGIMQLKDFISYVSGRFTNPYLNVFLEKLNGFSRK